MESLVIVFLVLGFLCGILFHHLVRMSWRNENIKAEVIDFLGHGFSLIKYPHRHEPQPFRLYGGVFGTGILGYTCTKCGRFTVRIKWPTWKKFDEWKHKKTIPGQSD